MWIPSRPTPGGRGPLLCPMEEEEVVCASGAATEVSGQMVEWGTSVAAAREYWQAE